MKYKRTTRVSKMKLWPTKKSVNIAPKIVILFKAEQSLVRGRTCLKAIYHPTNLAAPKMVSK